MKNLSVSRLSAHAVRWAVPCVAALSMSACGGGDAPTAAGSTAGAASAVAATSLDPPPPAPARPPAVAVASPGVATSAANATLFVAGVQPIAQRALAGTARRSADSASPAKWLDAEPPVGTASAPVMVVVAGALPQEAETQALTRSGAGRLAR